MSTLLAIWSRPNNILVARLVHKYNYEPSIDIIIKQDKAQPSKGHRGKDSLK
jgi:hypothetical protein